MLIRLNPDIPHQARQWRNNPSVYEWCRQHTLISYNEQSIWEDKIVNDPTIKMFGLEHIEIGSIGVCGFTSINYINRTAEFSLYIAPHHQGKRFSKPALFCLLHHGFRNFGFNRIWGETFDGNKAIKVFEDLGLQHEGTLRETYFKNGKFINSHIYAILAKDFLK